CFGESPTPTASNKILSASITFSKFSSGSPCPINTTFVRPASLIALVSPDLFSSPSSVGMGREAATLSPISFNGINTCATISPAVKFRINPNCAVKQNWQSTAQPACVDMQIVCRPSLGMNTASTAAGFFINCSSCAAKPNKYRTDPSDDTYLCRTVGNVIVASRPN